MQSLLWRIVQRQQSFLRFLYTVCQRIFQFFKFSLTHETRSPPLIGFHHETGKKASIFFHQFKSSSLPDPITRLLVLVVLHCAAWNGSPSSGEVSGTSRPLSRAFPRCFSRLKASFECLLPASGTMKLKNVDSIGLRFNVMEVTRVKLFDSITLPLVPLFHRWFKLIHISLTFLKNLLVSLSFPSL